MKWTPQPLDLTDVHLSDRGNQLLELVAENTHAIWGKSRCEEGWKYGPVRDDEKKETPCMVPYDQLPESEKAYDRRAAEQAIKAAIKLGMVKVIEEE